MKHLTRIVLLLILAQGLNTLAKDRKKSKEQVPSVYSNNLVQPENDVLFYDVYETTHGLSQRTKLGEAKLFFKDELNCYCTQTEPVLYSFFCL